MSRPDHSDVLLAMKADADRTRARMSSHSGHGQMAAWAALGERLAKALDSIACDGPDSSVEAGS